jgi:hypothetical protein
MRNIDQIFTRLVQLRDHLEEVEVMMACPSHSAREKKTARNLATTIACQIEQMEWVLGMRERTWVDELNNDEMPFSIN